MSAHPGACRYTTTWKESHEPRRLGRSYIVLLGLVVLVPPSLSLAEHISGHELQSFPVIGLVGVLALFVLSRLAAGVQESERLRREVRAQNERLAEVAAIVESTDDAITASTLDGTIVPVSLTVSTVRDAEGVVRGVSTIARDISDRRTAEVERDALLRELAEQNERLRDLDRMKDDFVASVSHELRTPLTSIRGYLELVREDGRLDDEQDRMFGIVDRNADRLLGLVSDLLFMAQVDAGKLTLESKPVQLADVAAESVEAANPRADASELELRLEVDDEPVVDGDRMRLGQVFDNLISNAIKFTPTGGRVGVRVFRSDATAAVQGTGLGLAIVGAITESHGGTVSVESRVGGGTTFVVRLPLAVRQPDTTMSVA